MALASTGTDPFRAEDENGRPLSHKSFAAVAYRLSQKRMVLGAMAHVDEMIVALSGSAPSQEEAAMKE